MVGRGLRRGRTGGRAVAAGGSEHWPFNSIQLRPQHVHALPPTLWHTIAHAVLAPYHCYHLSLGGPDQPPPLPPPHDAPPPPSSTNRPAPSGRAGVRGGADADRVDVRVVPAAGAAGGELVHADAGARHQPRHPAGERAGATARGKGGGRGEVGRPEGRVTAQSCTCKAGLGACRMHRCHLGVWKTHVRGPVGCVPGEGGGKGARLGFYAERHPRSAASCDVGSFGNLFLPSSGLHPRRLQQLGAGKETFGGDGGCSTVPCVPC